MPFVSEACKVLGSDKGVGVESRPYKESLFHEDNISQIGRQNLWDNYVKLSFPEVNIEENDEEDT